MKDWQLFGQFAQRFHTLTSEFLDKVSVPRGQAAALLVLSNEEGMTQSRLGSVLWIQGATVTTMLQRMEENELVRRERDPNDNRLVRVFLTPHGEQKVNEIKARLADLQDYIWRGISDAEHDQMRALVLRLLANMEDAPPVANHADTAIDENDPVDAKLPA